MPIVFSDHKLPSGELYLRMVSSEEIGHADCDALSAQLDRPEHRMGKAISVIETSSRASAEIRERLGGFGSRYSAIATVVTSPILRAMVNIMSRLAPAEENHKTFKDEASAIAWLDRQPWLRDE